MKKLLSMLLSLVFAVSFIIPATAEEFDHFDGEIFYPAKYADFLNFYEVSDTPQPMKFWVENNENNKYQNLEPITYSSANEDIVEITQDNFLICKTESMTEITVKGSISGVTAKVPINIVNESKLQSEMLAQYHYVGECVLKIGDEVIEPASTDGAITGSPEMRRPLFRNFCVCEKQESEVSVLREFCGLMDGFSVFLPSVNIKDPDNADEIIKPVKFYSSDESVFSVVDEAKGEKIKINGSGIAFIIGESENGEKMFINAPIVVYSNCDDRQLIGIKNYAIDRNVTMVGEPGYFFPIPVDKHTCSKCNSEVEVYNPYVPENILGDVNCDGTLSVADVRMMIVSIANGKTDDISFADMNDDGKITVADARKILMMLV